MKYLLLTAGFFAFLQSAQAGELIESYTAKLGSADHFNSRGTRLSNVAAIIRQDRANFHKFGKRDAQDQWDAFFASKSNRALLESMLNNGYISKQTRNQIVNGTPIITVNIYSDYIEVLVP